MILRKFSRTLPISHDRLAQHECFNSGTILTPKVYYAEPLVPRNEMHFLSFFANLITGNGRASVGGKAYPNTSLKDGKFDNESGRKDDREHEEWFRGKDSEARHDFTSREIYVTRDAISNYCCKQAIALIEGF
jgi:hypothetical protein